MEPQTVVVPLEKLDPVAPLVQKDEDRTGENVFTKLVTNDGQ